MAMENPLIVADVIEANEFQELSERYRVQSVPKTVINDRDVNQGVYPEQPDASDEVDPTDSAGSPA